MDLTTLAFPRHVHKPSVPGAWVYLRVNSEAECAAALAEGWSLTPQIIGQDAPTVEPPVVGPADVPPVAAPEPAGSAPSRRGRRR